MLLKTRQRSTGWLAKLIVITVLLSPAWLSGCSDSNSDHSSNSVSITLLHTNDTHSHLESFTPYGEPEQGGVARRKTLIESIRNEVGKEQVLLVDAGDFTQGTIFYNAWKGSADIMALNELGYDAGTLGNHEFDLGPQQLGRAITGEAVEIADVNYLTEPLEMPLISTNLDVSGEPALNDLIGSSIVIEKGGGQIAIIGVVTETLNDIANTGLNIIVNDYLTSIQAEVNRLTLSGINKIILLSHAGFTVDRQKATQLSGVDIIVSGHDHPLLLDTSAYTPLPFLADRVSGDYPTIVNDLDNNPLLIVAAYEWGKILGRLDVTFDNNGVITAWNGDPILVDDSIHTDAELADKLTTYKDPITAFSEVEIGLAGEFFDGNRTPGVRNQEMPLGNLITDAILQAASNYDSAVATIINGGSIRDSLPQDIDPLVDPPPYSVSYGDALNVLPFSSTITTLDVSGQQLIAALDNGLSWAYDSDAMMIRSSGAFPQVSGLSLTYCSDTVADMHSGINPPSDCPTALLAGGVVTSLEVAGVPVELSATYRIATNNFLAGGGDFYGSFDDACNEGDGYCRDSGILILDAFIENFSSTSPVFQGTDNRLIAE